MIASIGVFKTSRVNGQGNPLVLAAVKVDDTNISDRRVIQQPGQTAHVSGPQTFKYDCWRPLIKLTSTMLARIQAAVLCEWHPNL
jgi:hypothetical protein